MLSLSQQHFFMNKGLNLKEVFLLNILKSLKQPITLQHILFKFPILALKQRQYSQLLEKLEDSNMLVKVKGRNGSHFIFPFIKCAKKRILKIFKTCRKSHKQNASSCEKSHIFSLNKYYINKYYFKKLHNVVVNDSNIFSSSRKSNKEVSFNLEIKKIFKREFPKKNNYINCEIPKNFDIYKLIKYVKESPFLTEKDSISLNWCIKNYEAVISGFYKPYEYKENQNTAHEQTNKEFSERIYTKEYLDSLFDTLDDIEV